MKKVSKNLRNNALVLSSLFISHTLIPTAFAAPWGAGGDPRASTTVVASIIKALMTVFRDAGVILLAYSLFNLIISIKNEDAESKVNAASQIAVAITCITMSSILQGFLTAMGVTENIT